MQVIKRDGRIVDFEPEKIVDAIIGAMIDTDKTVDEELAWDVADEIFEEFSDTEDVPSVESIQDRVEVLLAENGRFDVARKYIVYRDERTKVRNHGWEMTDLQRDIFEKKYRHDEETFSAFLERVSAGNKPIKKAIRDKKFMPAGRILAGRGLHKLGKKMTLSNCYVLPKVDDNIESIFDTAKHLARTYSYGGGVGVNISKLRPYGSRVNNAASTTTGAVSFMELYSLVTGLIGMRGRRGALMLNMDVNHPDIEDFVDIKNDLGKITHANISVNVNDEFMQAVKDDTEYRLVFRVEATGEIIAKVVNARELFRKLTLNNWAMAEPGILYQDKINQWHLMSLVEDFEFAGVNPCAEEPLPAFGSCNLSSIDLSAFVKNAFTKEAYFDYEEFKNMVYHGVIYLNEVLDENMDLHPLKEQKEVSANLRQIGLGIMGTADMFIKMGVRYGSKESIMLIDEIGRTLINSALKQSAYLARDYGPFPLYEKEAVMSSPFFMKNADAEVIRLVDEFGLRNSQLLTIAPTGTISTLVGCSNGVEPIFQISYTRKSESLHDIDTYYKVFTPIAKEYMTMYGLFNEEELPDFFVTTTTLNYKDRINVQAAWQKYIDASISSTVNVPNEFTVEEVEDLYMYAWEMGLKGITIYRDGCDRSGILISDKEKEAKDNKTTIDQIDELKQQMDRLIVQQLSEDPDMCPMCGGEMQHAGGCSECIVCGYSPCSI